MKFGDYLNSKVISKRSIDHVYFYLEKIVSSSYHLYFQSGDGKNPRNHRKLSLLMFQNHELESACLPALRADNSIIL